MALRRNPDAVHQATVPTPTCASRSVGRLAALNGRGDAAFYPLYTPAALEMEKGSERIRQNSDYIFTAIDRMGHQTAELYMCRPEHLRKSLTTIDRAVQSRISPQYSPLSPPLHHAHTWEYLVADEQVHTQDVGGRGAMPNARSDESGLSGRSSIGRTQFGPVNSACMMA
jgi:hypothetical protein